MLFAFIICIVFEMISKIPEEVEEDLNNKMKKKDKKKILKAQ